MSKIHLLYISKWLLLLYFLTDKYEYLGVNFLMDSTTSCKTRCNHNDTHTCKCDAECEVFGDCCVDFKTHCHANYEDIPSIHDAVVQKNLSVCTTDYHYHKADTGWIFSKCPSSWTEHLLRSRCSSHSINMHVYDRNGYNYRNIYCALCHNRTIKDISFWDADDSLDLAKGCPTDLTVIDDMIKRQIHTIRGRIFRKCFVSNQCHQTFSNLTIKNACSSYVYPLFECLKVISYRNPHCSLCSQIEGQILVKTCALGSETGFLAQDLWDFRTPARSTTSSSIRCSLGEIADPVLQTCRPIICATGNILVAGKCVLDNNTESVDLVGSLDCEEQVTLIILRGRRTVLTCVDAELKRHVKVNETHAFKHQASLGDDMWIAYKFNDESANKILKTIKNESHSNMYILQDLLINCNINETEIISVCSQKTDECSGKWISGSPSDFRRIIEFENITDVYLKDTIYFQADIKVYSLNYYSQHRTHNSYEVMLFCAHIIDSPFLDCPMITLSRKEYYVNMSSLYYRDIKFETNEYTILSNGDAYVCLNVIENQPKLSSKLSKRYRFVSGALDTVHFLFSCLSILSLFGTLVTYVKFKQLQNLQGTGVMCLSLALMFANVFTVLSDKIPLSGSVCIAFAAITHYFWLAAFTWMTIISTIMIDTFVFNPAKPSRKSTISFSMALLAGWGTPFLIILFLLFLHFCESCFTSDIIIYDGDLTCWLATSTINLYAFGVPVVFSLTTNLVLITITLISLRKARQTSNRLQQKRKKEEAWKEAVVLCKVSLIL